MSISKSRLLERRQWRSLAEWAGESESPDWDEHEFPPGATEIEMDGISRRRFLGAMGASMALAGVSTTAGCWRKPVEHIVPYAQRPEFIVPGVPNYYRTAALIGQSVLGLHVESQEGRPTKIEGNPDHPMSNPRGVLSHAGVPYGATNAWAQASVLDLYDPDRLRLPKHGDRFVYWADFWAFFDEHLAGASRGQGLAVLLEAPRSPTLRRVLADFQRVRPAARVFTHDPVDDEQVRAGGRLVGAGQRRLLYNLDRADVVVALDADFLGTEGDVVRNQALFGSRRRVESPDGRINRLYAIEPAFTITGAHADSRVRIPASHVGRAARALASYVLAENAAFPYAFRSRVLGDVAADDSAEWGQRIAEDLLAHRGRAVVIVGQRQPAWVHALGHLINHAIEAVGATVEYVEDASRRYEPIGELAAAIEAGDVDTLLMLGGDPAFTAPGDVDFAGLLAGVGTTIHVTPVRNETTGRVDWQVPGAHYLECWGDWLATDGTAAIQQPLIAPLHARTDRDYPDHKGAISAIDLLGRIVSSARPGVYADEVRATPRDEDMGYGLVRETWFRAVAGDFEQNWRRWLHDGVVSDGPEPRISAPNFNWDGLLNALDGVEEQGPSDVELELNFYPDYSVYDGRYANNGWLVEMPDPMTKLTWDNVVQLSNATAERLQVSHGDLVVLEVGGRRQTMAAMTAPGTADNTAIVTLGYGRRQGRVAAGVGFDTYRLRGSDAPHIALGARLQREGGSYELATTQHHHRMRPREGFDVRPLVIEASLAQWEDDPDFADYELLSPEERRFGIYEPRYLDAEQQWGMSIDLTACTGCSACVIACQAENNIPVVTKERVLAGREMHWIRIDRYYTGDDPDEVGAVVQPIPCMQCENAPCEVVCPVGATVHSPEGLNDMAYNRCIGTRYCSNNCPYKVRRFNYFNYGRENDERSPMHRMQNNPDVTVRFRGVMEKCTYCVQRIEQAKIANHRAGNDRVADGGIITACAQACPSRAIVFGDIHEEGSEVARLKSQSRDYELLGELNNRPRTTFLAKIRNPNPVMV